MSKKLFSKFFVLLLVVGLLFAVAPTRQAQAATPITLGSGYATALGADAISTDYVIGTGSWSSNGNLMEFQFPPSLLGLTSVTVDQIDSVVYRTKDGTAGGVDWGFYIYTVGTKYGWYGERLISEPMYSIAYDGAPANTWNTWDTSGTANQLAFYDSHYSAMGFYYGPTLADIKAGPINWADYGYTTTSIDYGAQSVLLFKFGTGSAWSSTFFGLLDAIELTINGVTYSIDLEEFVPVSYVDDDWAGLSFGVDPDGSGPAVAFGNDAFATIQQAISATAAGGTVNVAAGTYDEENIVISKGITLQGAGATNTSIAPSAITDNCTIVVQNPSGNVTINGFNFVMQPKVNYGSAVLVTGTTIGIDSATVTISNNVVTGSDNGTKSDYGFYGQGNNAKIIIKSNTINKTGDNPIVMEQQFGSSTVENNTFYITASPDYDAYYSMVHSGQTISTPQIVQNNVFHLDHSGAGYSQAISFTTAVLNAWGGQPNDSGHYTAINVLNNTVYTEGPNARGIGLNDRSSVLGNGTITAAVVTGNKIIGEAATDAETYGITLRGDVRGAVLQNNEISNVNIGFRAQKNLDSGSTLICSSGTDFSLNKVTSVTTAAQNSDCTVAVDASPNWWGQASGPAAGQIVGNVNYIPWCGEAACTTLVYPPVHNVTQGTYFYTIQAAVDAAADGNVIEVGPGTYNEQVEITKDLTIVGAGIDTSIIKAPATLPVASDPRSAIVLVHGAGVQAEISGFSISGPGPSGCGSIRAGVYVYDSADLNLHDNKLIDIRDSGATISGCQNGIAVSVGRNYWSTSGTATIEDNIIVNYQKGAIVVDNTGSNAVITGNTVTGAGTTGITAQNGIQISRGATATISENTVSGNSFHVEGSTWDWGATGVLLYDAGDVTFAGGNNFSGNDSHVYISGAGAVTMDDETFGDSSAPIDSGYFVINYNDAPLDLTQAIFPTTDPYILAVRIWDGIDEAGQGLARFEVGHLYVTEGGSIQRAIDLATAGDTIHVADGLYNYETEGHPADKGLIKITKPVTLKAADDGNEIRPVIDASGIGGLTNDGVFKIYTNQFQDGLVVIEGFDITGIPQTGIAITAMMYQVPGHENTIIIRDNLIHGMIGGIDFWGTTTFVTDPNPAYAVLSHVEITGNKIYDMGVAGVEQGLGVMIEDPKSFTDPAIYAAMITNNEFYNFVAKDPSNPSAAIVLPRADAANGEDLDVLIQDNKFGAGVNVDVGIQAGAAIVGPKILENDFSNAGIGVYSTITPTVDASRNWWGQDTGPVPADMLGNIKYLPYCLNPECTLFSQAKLSMSPATIDALTCGQQYVDVTVTEVADLTAYTMEVIFDKTKVLIDNVIPYSSFFAENTQHSVVSMLEDPGNDTGRMIFSAYLQAKGADGNPGPVSGSGTLIRIYYTPLLGTTTFEVDEESLLVGWPESDPMPFSVTGEATATLTGGLVENLNTGVNYCSLASAVAGASTTTNQTLQLLDSFALTETITINKALTLDTNGKTISRTVALSSNNSFVVVPGGDLTITGGGTITTTTGNAIQIAGDATTQAKVTLVSGTLDGANASVAIIGNRSYTNHDPIFKSLFVMTGGHTDETVLLLGNGAQADISGGDLTGFAPIMGNGTVSATQNLNEGGTIINISGEAYIHAPVSEDPGNPWLIPAIYHPQDGILTISGGTIIGTNGIEMKAGDLVVTGGTITGTGPYVATPPLTYDGSTDTGDAILIYNMDGYTGDLTVDISGGEITSTNSYALRQYVSVTEPATSLRTTDISISGGVFDGGAGAVTFTTTGPSHLALTDGIYNTDPGITGAADYVYMPYDTYVGTYESAPWFMIDPVDITATTVAGPYTAGVPQTVTITVAATNHTGPFQVVFTYPAGTTIKYGDTTVVCTSSGCPAIDVTLSDLSFVVTLPAAGTYDVGVALNHNAGEGDIRLLDSDTATGVVVSGNFTITGDFSMQGRVERGDIPVTLTWGGTLVPYGPSADTTDVIGNNFTLLVNYGGTYTITTNQPRYLNVITATGKTIMVDGNEILPALRLRGGNARWMNSDGTPDDIINGGDASIVGTQYGTGGTSDLLGNNGDCNFDGKVNIQDLALVGGNFDLTSATAYAAWLP